nr:hypothetical protein [uncultured Romboutsia sp.]
MAVERKNRNVQNMYDECRKLMNYHVVFSTRDGSTLDGIIESVDQDKVIILVGEDIIDQECDNQYNQQRQFGSPRRFRRFRRRAFPLGSLIALSLLAYPFFAPPFVF